jgi:hypothetical protein
VLSLHCPLTPATRHLINAETLQLMRSDAVLIITRGALVDGRYAPCALAAWVPRHRCVAGSHPPAATRCWRPGCEPAGHADIARAAKPDNGL